MAAKAVSKSDVVPTFSPETATSERQTEGSFVNGDGLHIFCKYWYPPEGQEIRALVLVVHGLGEHCARYDTVAASFNKLGCLVFAHDHIGHGRSEGIPVDVTDFEKYVADCMQHVDLVTAKFPTLPLIMFGHSMGGTIAILTLNANPYRFIGGVLMSPCIMVNPDTATPFLVFIGKIVARLCPQATISKLQAAHISRDPAVVADYENDPLVWHGGIKARFALNMMNACYRIQNECDKATYPFLLQHGSADQLCDIRGSDLFMEKAASKDKTYKTYQGYFHELEKEPEGEREVVIRDLEEWVKNLLDGRQAGQSVANGSDPQQIVET